MVRLRRRPIEDVRFDSDYPDAGSRPSDSHAIASSSLVKNRTLKPRFRATVLQNLKLRSKSLRLSFFV